MVQGVQPAGDQPGLALEREVATACAAVAKAVVVLGWGTRTGMGVRMGAGVVQNGERSKKI